MKTWKKVDWTYQNQLYKSGMIFDFWACGPAQNPKNDNGEVIFRGAYPAGFLDRLKAALYVHYPEKRTDVLHVCAGSVPKCEGLRVDNSKQFKPDILADAEDFADEFLKKHHMVKISISDPPYNKNRAVTYYKQKDKLSVINMIKQMTRVTEDNGFIVLLDQTSPNTGPHIPELKRIALVGVTSVPNTDCRLCTIWRKGGDSAE